MVNSQEGKGKRAAAEDDVFSSLPPLVPDSPEGEVEGGGQPANKEADTASPEPASPPTLSPETNHISPTTVFPPEVLPFERHGSARSAPSLSRSPTPQLAHIPFDEEDIVFEKPSTAVLCGVDAGFVCAGQRNSEMAKVKLHSTLTASPMDVDYYYIPDSCVLSTFAHVRLSKLVPSDTPLSVRCAVESDMIIAIHQENPLCLHSDFQRVMTNNSFSRFIASSGTNRSLQKWYRLYHKHLSVGTHEVVFATENSWKGSSMNQFTIFVRPSACLPKLDIKPLDDDSPPPTQDPK